MASTRNIKAPGVLASAATVGVPPTPIAGAAYRDPAALAVMLASGWKYGTPVNSAGENQYNFQASTLLDLLDRQGILGWCDLVNYGTPAAVFGSDGRLYFSAAASGPDTPAGARDPVSTSGFWNAAFADSRVGETVLVQGTASVPGAVKLNGALLSRTGIYAELYAWAVASGNIISDAAWTGDALNRGSYSTGDGATTFRVPNVRGLFPRFFHDGDTTDPDFATRGIGRVQGSQNLAHAHDQLGLATDTGSGTGGAGVFMGSSSVGLFTGSSGGTEARPINTPFMAWVKYRG